MELERGVKSDARGEESRERKGFRIMVGVPSVEEGDSGRPGQVKDFY
jgi:hypothetical protein